MSQTTADLDKASDVSFNFSVFKVLSMLCVVTSHFPIMPNVPTWIPTSIGLVIFAFSSAYFTTRIYGLDLDIAAFSRRKIERLAVRYWFLLFVLAILLLIQGRTVFHWHTVVHVFGLSGFLNLFGRSESELGAGLWFFTLLLLFYVSYPYLAKLAAISRGEFFYPMLVSLFFIYMDEHVVLPVFMWVTALGFILGVFCGMYEITVSSRASLAMTTLALALLLANNLVFDYRAANGALVAVAAICTNLWLMKASIPRWKPLLALAKLENILLEIFIVHTYLFVYPTGNKVVDYAVTMTLVIVSAWILNILGSALVRVLFNRNSGIVMTAHLTLESKS
nr:acyltransferase family protein [uncultured Massilia sp.]